MSSPSELTRLLHKRTSTEKESAQLLETLVQRGLKFVEGWPKAVCAKCGESFQHAPRFAPGTITECADCMDKAAKEIARQVQVATDLHNRLRRSRIPEEFMVKQLLPHQFDAWETGTAMKGRVASPLFTAAFAYIFGHVGSGKSVLAAWWLLSQIKKRGKVGVWVDFSELILMAQDNRAIRRLRSLARVDALVIDEMDPEQCTAMKAGILKGFISNRIANKRWTCITGNLTPRETVERHPDWTRTMDRLRVGSFIHLETPDKRSLRRNG